MSGTEGLLLIDKPVGPTSHDVVARIRSLTGQRRVGHAGTLDPPASGLLLIVLGRATRLVRFLPHSPKCYRGGLRLGVVTSTDDSSGEVLRRHDGPLPDAGQVHERARALVGHQLQSPPAVSARKVGGQRLYRLARRGVRVAVEPRPVEVLRFDLAPTASPADWLFETDVSAGTYVRALARDLGTALGCGATLTALRRTAVGPLRVDRAVSADSLDELTAEPVGRALIPLDDLPLEPPALRLDNRADAELFCSGGSPPLRPTGTVGLFRVQDPAGRLLGVAEAAGNRLRPRVVVGTTRRG